LFNEWPNKEQKCVSRREGKGAERKKTPTEKRGYPPPAHGNHTHTQATCVEPLLGAGEQRLVVVVHEQAVLVA
jgi:hypothetical protein